VLLGTYHDLFTAAASCAAALTGLLFVALSVGRRNPAYGPEVVQQVRAAAALLAFNNTLVISLFSLVPGTNTGYPAITMGVIGSAFTAAAVRSIWTSESTRRQQMRQLGLVGLLLLIFGTEFVAGILILASPNSSAAELIGYAVVTSLIVGIARAWELIGDRDTGILASLAVLTGHPLIPDDDPDPGTAADPPPQPPRG
jgi:hypothetical protein